MPVDTRALPDPIGWFQIGWTGEIPNGGVRPIRFCGRDLVVYREDGTREDGTREEGTREAGVLGALHVLDAHCLHLGANLGRGGRVCGTEIECPFHRWRWGADGRNTHVPDMARPHKTAGLRVWPCDERNGCIYVWHHPDGGEPLWPVVDAFDDLLGKAGESADDYYPPHPHGAVRIEGVTTHPKITADNIADFRHFKTVHGTGLPELREWKADDATFRAEMDFRSGRDGALAASLTLVLSGVGIVFTRQDGNMPQRVSLSTTPVGDGRSDLLLTTWIRREDGDADGTSEPIARRYAAAAAALPQDIEIWAHQHFVERPLLAPYERGLAEFRAWARAFDPPSDAGAVANSNL